uniref:Uncharacterized protein n=1 Tax=Rhizophora mucronata TaxID=61149 RepID=A0A2P2QYP8_RHIMU
MNLSVNNANFL